jgi:hypothetical protein
VSYRALFAPIISHLSQRHWPKDIEAFVQELGSALAQSSAIELREPLTFNNHTNGPAIQVNNVGSQDHHGVWVTSALTGQQVRLGIGLGSENVVANELIPLPNATIDPAKAHEKYSTPGAQGGNATVTPNTQPFQDGSYAGPGLSPDGQAGGDLNSGYQSGESGSGIPGGGQSAAILGGIGRALASIQKSTSTYAPSGSAYQLTLNGTTLNLIRSLENFSPTRATIDSVSANTLSCTRVTFGDTITVAKPPRLQGVTASPVYAVGETVYVRWIPNGTDVSGVNWLDINVDARTA